MAKDYSPDQLWPLYEKLPEDLQDAIFSEKTADTISDVCARNELSEEKIPEIAKYAGYVLLGVLKPDELEKTLKDDLKLKNGLAKKISWEISRFIFFPLKASLEMIYKIEMAPAVKPPEGVIEETKTKDTYREPIE